MKNEKIVFDAFVLDSLNECLWCGTRAIRLRPKAFALLAYLVGRPGQLVTKEELLDAVWHETFVGDAVLKVTVRQLRETLGDSPKAPRYIETAHRRGYRFIGRIAESDVAGAAPPTRSSFPSPTVVGRDAPLARMRGRLERMLNGERQLLFVTGEPGIGKTALVDEFTSGIDPGRGVLVGRGQCLEQYGTSEAYMPVLEAIGRLCRERREVAEALRAHAPMWLLQMPGLVSASERESLHRQTLGATRERMLREIGEALEALTTSLPLVLVLEDLHWSDYSTTDLISYLARQRRAVKLMVVGTYRPADLIVGGHPLKGVKQELLAKRQCEEVPLDYLDEGAVAEYLDSRFLANRFPAALPRLIHDRTEGNPLFMVSAVDYLAAAGVVAANEECWELAVDLENVEVEVPDSIRQMIEAHLDSIGPELRRTLEAASVAGAEFSTLAVVAALGEDRPVVEERCAELARHRHFICDCGVQQLSNGETVMRYGFVHAVYRSVLYERIPPPRRALHHRRIAEEGEAVYGERAREIAAELAMHFERGTSYTQAVKYLQQAAENALRRFAYREAIELARRGLELLQKLPDTPERTRSELYLNLTLGVPLIATEGYAAPAVGGVYLEARELCRRLGGTPDEAEALWGLWTFYTLRAALHMARETAEELLCLSERFPAPGLAMRGHWASEVVFMHMGDFPQALEWHQKALALYDPECHLDDAFLYAQHPGVVMRSFAAWTLWFLGQPEQASERMQEALTLARDLSEPHGLAHALCSAAILHQLRREPRAAREHAEAALAVSRAHEFILYEAMASVVRGWSLIEAGPLDEAIEQIRRGLASNQATGTGVLRPHLLALLAEALEKDRRPEEGLRALDEALDVARRTGEGSYLAEIHRMKGELLLAASACTQMLPEECFRTSVEIARRQKALSLELRASTSLARLLKAKGNVEEARDLLSRVVAAFTEGVDTADLLEARALLDELSAGSRAVWSGAEV